MSHLSRAAQKIWAQGLETHEDPSFADDAAAPSAAASSQSPFVLPMARSGAPYLTYSSAAPLQPQTFHFASPTEDGAAHVPQRSTRALFGSNAAPIGASHSRPSTAGRISSSTPITDAAVQRGANVPTYRPAATKAAAEALGLKVQASAKGSIATTSRPGSSSARRPPSASSSAANANPRPTTSCQPTNTYGQPAAAYASDEKDASGSSASLNARMIASAAAHRPAFTPSRPTSSAGFYSSSGASRSRPSSAVANLAFGQAAPSAAHKPGKMPASARGTSRANVVDCYDPHSIITVRTAKETDAEEQRRHDRSSGLLLTTRARPAFSARFDSSGHSTFPLSASALRPNAGFHSELMVSHERLQRFQDSCSAEEKHFYSKNLFWEYKLTELLRATEEEQAASANGKDILRTTTEGSQTERPQSGKKGNSAAKIAPVSDAVYPSTYRTLCASAILKQVVPTLLAPPLPKSMASPSVSTSTALGGKGPTKATRELLALTLSILHRSIYQPPSTLTPPNPRAHSIDSDLGDGLRSAEDLDMYEGVEEKLSERVKRLRAVQGSGYAQAAINAVGKTVSSSASDPSAALHTRSSSAEETMDEAMTRAMSVEGRERLIDGVMSKRGQAEENSSAAHAFSIPFALSTRYLYESVQATQQEEESREDKVRRVERQIGKMEAKTTRRVCRVTFHIWRAYVKLQKQKANLNVFLTSKGMARRTKMEPELIFHMWKSWSQRSKMKRAFRHQLRTMAAQIRNVSVRLEQEGRADETVLQQHLAQIQSSFAALSAESTYSAVPIDIFSPITLTLVQQRFLGQLQIIASYQYVDLLPLCPSYTKSSDLSIEVDLLLNEIGRISHSASALSDVRQHLLAKVESVERRAGQQEQSMMETLLYLSGEDFLFAWVNAHLANTGFKLEDLAELPRELPIWLALLRSVAPGVLDSTLASLRNDTSFGGGKSSATAQTSARAYGPESLGFGAATSKAEQEDGRMVGQARAVLESCDTLGCLPVVSLEEFLSHPAHASVIKRLKTEKERLEAMGPTGKAAIAAAALAASMNTGSEQLPPPSTSDDPSAFFSAHPGDAGLTPSQLGLPVDAQGRVIVDRKHMFEGLDGSATAAASTTAAGAEDAMKLQTTGKNAASSAGAPVRYSQVMDHSIRAHPHLHLSLLASLFLQRPSLPLTSSHTTAGVSSQEQWLKQTEEKVKGIMTEWEGLKSRTDSSLGDITAFLSSVQHIGLEIDIIMQRSQRRAGSFDQVKEKMEDLLWTLQKRKGTGTANSVDKDAVRRANTKSVSHEYVEIPMARMLDILNQRERSLQDYSDLKLLLGKHYEALASIFRHYSTLDNNNSDVLSTQSTMRFSEFLTLVIDCHLLSAKISKGVLQVIFTRCSQSSRELQSHSLHSLPFTDQDRLMASDLSLTKPKGRIEEISAIDDGARVRDEEADGASMTADEAQDEAEFRALSSPTSAPSDEPVLTQAGLFECFVRLAHAKFTQVQSIPERVRRLLEMDILPNACRLKLDEFRSLLNRDRVKLVFLSHRLELQAIFHHFAKEEPSHAQIQREHPSTPIKIVREAASRGRMMTKASFVRMAYEAKLIVQNSAAGSSSSGIGFLSSSSATSVSNPLSGLSLSESQLLSLFARILRLPPGRPVEFDVSYAEFLECLGAIAVWKHPDPYLPIQVKLEKFVAQVLIPPLRKTVRRLNQILVVSQQAQQRQQQRQRANQTEKAATTAAAQTSAEPTARRR